jgi:hypothetical protein
LPIVALFRKSEWSEKDFKQFKREYDAEHGFIVTKLDEALIGYPGEVADRKVTCENFAAFLMSGVATTNHGVLGKFIQRSIERKLVRKDNYPNIFEFENDVAKLTENFERKEPIDCSKIPRRSWFAKLVDSWSGFSS